MDLQEKALFVSVLFFQCCAKEVGTRHLPDTYYGEDDVF